MSCDHKETMRLGFGIFCKQCNKRVGFVDDKTGEKLMIEALKQDIKSMGGKK